MTPYPTDTMRSRPHWIPRNTELTAWPGVGIVTIIPPTVGIPLLSDLLHQGLLHRRAQLGRAERLEEDGAEPHLPRLLDDLGRGVGGGEKESHVGTQGPGLGEDLEAVHAGHLVIEQHQVEVLGAD